jgi:4-hydroxybenzoyl-CoA thioesterase
LTAYSYSRRLNWSECDPGGIIFFPNYARWAIDGLNEMLQTSGYQPNRELPDGGIEGIPCVEFNMRFFNAPRLHSVVEHEIAVIRTGSTSFTARHLFSGEGVTYAEVVDTRVWAVHANGALRKQSLPDEVLVILRHRGDSAASE